MMIFLPVTASLCKYILSHNGIYFLPLFERPKINIVFSKRSNGTLWHCKTDSQFKNYSLEKSKQTHVLKYHFFFRFWYIAFI